MRQLAIITMMMMVMMEIAMDSAAIGFNNNLFGHQSGLRAKSTAFALPADLV